MIFCVEDDAGIRDLMVYALDSAGFEARGLEDGAELEAALREETPQLIMLDIMLPGEDGLSILKDLRRNAATADIPVIMATARGTEYDKVIGLDLGADDYLAKPFGMMEMVSRVRAVLRRVGQERNEGVLRAGGLTMDVRAHSVFAGERKIELTLKEFGLLRKFMENPGVAFSREQLLADVWEEGYMGESRTVDVHIGTLRTKLGPWGELIRTVRGVGYRMEEKL